MQIQAKIEYDPGNQQISGYATLPSNIENASESKQAATHAMVFILAGITYSILHSSQQLPSSCKGAGLFPYP